MDRVYTWVPAWPLNLGMWMSGLRRGRTFATNGPLINFTLGKEMVGSEIQWDAAQNAVPFTARLRSVVPVDHLEIVCNGKIAKSLSLEGKRDTADIEGTLPITTSGWCLLRAWTEKAEYPVMDKYAYATTSPIYINVAGKKSRSPEDAKYFAAWIQRTIDITEKYPDWNSPLEKDLVMQRLREAGTAVLLVVGYFILISTSWGHQLDDDAYFGRKALSLAVEGLDSAVLDHVTMAGLLIAAVVVLIIEAILVTKSEWLIPTCSPKLKSGTNVRNESALVRRNASLKL
jgi:hypothetical protein